jgi:CarD family transcriptional regulator
MFCLNDMVVYPAFGVARLTREVVKKIDKEEIFFYELNFINKDVKILIPKDNINSVGLRNLNDKDYIEDLLKGFFMAYSDSWLNDISLTSWNRRTKDYQSKIRCGNMKDIAKIYRDLKNIEKNKILSFGEKAILNQVEELLCEEISIVYGKDIREVVISIRNFTINSLSKCVFVDNINLGFDGVDFYSMVFKQNLIEK